MTNSSGSLPIGSGSPGRGLDRRHARDGGSLASGRLPFLLALDLSGPNASRGRRLSKVVRDLIFRMVTENPTWSAPRIHGELPMQGLDVSERTISRWMRRAPRDPEPAKRWLRWISSRSQRSPSECSAVFSSSAMIVGATCTSTSQTIRRACGSSSSCEKCFRLGRPRGASSSIVMPSRGRKSPPRSDQRKSNVSALRCRVLGRMELRSVGLKGVAATC